MRSGLQSMRVVCDVQIDFYSYGTGGATQIAWSTTLYKNGSPAAEPPSPPAGTNAPSSHPPTLLTFTV